MQAPPLVARWFRALQPKQKNASTNASSNTPVIPNITPNTPQNITGAAGNTLRHVEPPPSQTASVATTAQQWEAFAPPDSDRLEHAFSLLKHRRLSITDPEAHKSDAEEDEEGCVPVGDDMLYEVVVLRRVMRPIYWEGKTTHSVVRALWFHVDASGKRYIPADENLAAQLEDGYAKFKPYLSQTIDSAVKPTAPKKEQRWALFGPYLDSYVVYTGPKTAWLLTDNLTGKLFQAIFMTISSGENMGGSRLVRGFDYVQQLGAKADKSTDAQIKESGNATAPAIAATTTAASTSSSLSFAERSRNLRHLVLVVHGVGQKLSERMNIANIINEAQTLHKTLNQCAKTIDPSITSPSIMVIPIEWRKRIRFDRRTPGEQEDEYAESELPRLQDITIDGVPSLRMIISDVALDVLLYMTPHHRNDMTRAVVTELNRVYALFRKRHPSFEENGGKIHMYGHSLGSVIALDLLSHHARPIVEDVKTTEIVLDDLEAMDLADPNMNAAATNNTPGSGTGAVTPKRRGSNGTLKRNMRTPTNLAFDVDKFFAAGSPIGLFLLLQEHQLGAPRSTLEEYFKDWTHKTARELMGGQIVPSAEDKLWRYVWTMVRRRLHVHHGTHDRRSSIQSQSNVSETAYNKLHPALKAIYNLCHPHDPISYRLEPLIHKQLAQEYTKPVWMPYTKGGLRHLTDMVSRGTGEVAKTATGWVGSMFKRNSESAAATLGAMTGSECDTEDEGSNKKKSRPAAAMGISSTPASPAMSVGVQVPPIPTLTPEETLEKLNKRRKRLDFSIQEGVFENAYLSALGAHMVYWSDQDCCMFVTKELLEIE